MQKRKFDDVTLRYSIVAPGFMPRLSVHQNLAIYALKNWTNFYLVAHAYLFTCIYQNGLCQYLFCIFLFSYLRYQFKNLDLPFKKKINFTQNEALNDRTAPVSHFIGVFGLLASDACDWTDRVELSRSCTCQVVGTHWSCPAYSDLSKIYFFH